MLRSDNREQWEKLDKAISKKMGRIPLGLVGRDSLNKVKEVIATELQKIRTSFEDSINKNFDIIKNAASSAVKPPEAGKKLKGKLKHIIKSDSPQTIRERLAQKAKEAADRENGTTEEEDVPKDVPVGEPVEEVPEVEDAEQPVAEAQIPEQGVEEIPEEPAPQVTPEEQLPIQEGELPPEEIQPGEEVPQEGVVPQDEAIAQPGIQPELQQEPLPPGDQPYMEEGQPPLEESQISPEGVMPEEAIPQEVMEEQPQGLHVGMPDPTFAQANDGQEQEKLLAMQDELQRLHGTLQEIQGLAEEQGLLTTEELENIIIPLIEETEGLMQTMQANDEYRQRPKREYGPRNQVGSISRDLSSPTSNFAQSAKTTDLSKKTIEKFRDGAHKLNKSDLQKGGPGSGPNPGVGKLADKIYKEEGKGWHGDSAGHAAAARARWGGAGGAGSAGGDVVAGATKTEGALTKPYKNPIVEVTRRAGKLGGEVVQELAVDTKRALRRGGRGIADAVGDTISDYGGEAVVAGVTAYLVSTLKGEKRSLKDYLGDMKSEVVARIDEVKDWKVVRRLTRSNEAKMLRTLSNRAKFVASKAGSSRAGQLSGKALRFAVSAAKGNPRVAAALFVASALGAEGARRVGAKVKATKKSTESTKSKKTKK